MIFITSFAASSAALASLIKGATLTGRGMGLEAGGSAKVSRPSGRRAFRLLVSPFRTTTPQPGPSQPAATVFIFDPHAQTEDTGEALARLYGFTPGETRVATLLMHGLDIAEAADQLGIARSTTRNVVKRLFMKTGTNRQAELVRELLVGPAQIAR
jgi:DNA-binding CsgD family transcriptional regulator